MLNQNIAIEEDEDVIFEGSALHEHLFSFGYADFEITPVIKTKLKQQKKSTYMDSNIINDICKKTCSYILRLRSWIIQDCCLSKEQLHTILRAEALLDDHAAVINSYEQKFTGCMLWKKVVQNLFVSSTLVATSIYLLLCKNKNAFNSSMVLCVIYFTGYRNYSDIRAYKDLNQLILLQNELYNLCKKGLKILKYGYNIKVNSGKINQQFHDLMGERLIYLQPIMDNLVEYLENISQIYHHIISIIIAQLPKYIFEQYVTTTFKNDAFKIRGEINYEAIKRLYHTSILLRSELLYLLAVAYGTNNKVSKTSLMHIANKLIERLAKYRNKLSPCIDSYYNCKTKPIVQYYKGSTTSNWQDVYLHLNLTSSKIRLAYDYIMSMINDIDAYNDNASTIISNEMIEKMMQKINETYKQIDAARSFTEFCSLLITKTKHKNFKMSYTAPEICTQNVDTNLPVITDTEPEIFDEVFEEYIKEEYLKPLYEEDQENLLQEYKVDKLLAKNFMSELKEALIDKQRSMSERESKALQRMYRNVINSANDLESKSSKSSIPVPPPLPSLVNDFTPIHSYDSISQNCKSVHVESIYRSSAGISCKKTLDINSDNNDYNYKNYTNTKNVSVIENTEEDSVAFQPLSLRSLEQPIGQFGLNIAPPLRFMTEETFIGSGENSESDVEPGDD